MLLLPLLLRTCERLAARFPVHVTVRRLPGLPNPRSKEPYDAPVAEAHPWLLKVGWRRMGLSSAWATPGDP